jgi:hypothetical protein
VSGGDREGRAGGGRPENDPEPRLPYRERVMSCPRGGTFKYFFARSSVAEVWRRLEEVYGAARRNEAFKSLEIEESRFIFRATYLMNPITVFRKRSCSDFDVAEFHALVGYRGD